MDMGMSSQELMNIYEEEEEEENGECKTSTGYLEDVLSQFSSKSKRRRIHFIYDYFQRQFQYHHYDLQNCWPPLHSNCFHNLTTTATITEAEILKTPEEEGVIVYDQLSSSSHKQNISDSDSDIHNSLHSTPHKHHPIFSSASGVEEKRKKRVMSKVVYPFALVKPGRFEGDDVATLNDINERILMPPTRPVRHPVGDFACRPLVSPDGGPGLSGKTVVAFTRVHTQGRGTITIIRTRG